MCLNWLQYVSLFRELLASTVRILQVQLKRVFTHIGIKKPRNVQY